MSNTTARKSHLPPIMGIISSFTSPQDIRWQGPQRIHHIIFLIKNFILVPFIILVIVEYALFKSWWEDESFPHSTSWEWAPYRFWLRIGLALIPDLLLTLVSLVLILNPMHHSTYSFHPVFALVTSFVMMSLYVNVSWLNPIVAMSREVWFVNADTWESLVLVETGFQGVLCIVWIVLVGYSCAAVHWWRKEKRGAAVKLGGLDKQEGLEN